MLLLNFIIALIIIIIVIIVLIAVVTIITIIIIMIIIIIATYFSPIYLGVGVPGGCEAATHASRRFVLNMPDDFIVVKLDFSNAFNCLHRDSMLESIKQSIPEIYPFCLLSYDSVLKFGSSQIFFHEGI